MFMTMFEYQQRIGELTHKYFFGEINTDEYIKGMNELSSQYYLTNKKVDK
jgi:hypothetical protein